MNSWNYVVDRARPESHVKFRSYFGDVFLNGWHETVLASSRYQPTVLVNHGMVVIHLTYQARSGIGEVVLELAFVHPIDRRSKVLVL